MCSFSEILFPDGEKEPQLLLSEILQLLLQPQPAYMDTALDRTQRNTHLLSLIHI